MSQQCHLQLITHDLTFACILASLFRLHAIYLRDTPFFLKAKLELIKY